MPKRQNNSVTCTIESEDDEIQVIEDSSLRINDEPGHDSLPKVSQKGPKISGKKKKIASSVRDKKSIFEVCNSSTNFSDVGGVDKVLVKVS